MARQIIFAQQFMIVKRMVDGVEYWEEYNKAVIKVKKFFAKLFLLKNDYKKNFPNPGLTFRSALTIF